MITFEEAKKYAMEIYRDIDCCDEYADAYIFGDSRVETIGGPLPVVVMKDGSDIITMLQYATTRPYTDPIRHWDKI